MTDIKSHPVEGLLRTDRIPHIWCPGCGVGTSVNCFARAITKVGMDLDKLHVVSGIGCTGRVAGYINADSFHTTHGRALAFATGLVLSRPDSKVVVYSGDGDLTAIGGNHLIHSARRNVNMTVICVNNYTYGMTGGQVTPTTPDKALASTAPFGNYEYTFNIPHLVASAGATYVARWTVFHVRQLTRAMATAIQHKGFSFIEVLSPCPTLYMRRNKLGAAVNLMEYFRENALVKDGADTATVSLDTGETILGEFVNQRRPTLQEAYDLRMREMLGDDYVPYEGAK